MGRLDNKSSTSSYAGRDVGVIGGALSSLCQRTSDDYFSLSALKNEKTIQMNSINNNNIFKLDYPVPNLATIVLAKWESNCQALGVHLWSKGCRI